MRARFLRNPQDTGMTLANTQYAEAIAKVGGYYNFVTMINRRMKELNNGQPPMVAPPANEKNWDKIDLIVKEIEAGYLTLKV
jgi:DNA-directed RNA polymerase subunit K/omega